MSTIEYTARDELALDAIAPLWLKLQEHHRTRGKEFAKDFGAVSWDQRRAGLLKRAHDGKILIDTACDVDRGQCVGYCVTSLSADLRGEIESIYVEAACRGLGVGDCLMRRALRFLDDAGATVKTLGVAAGNEEVFGFYRRYGFVPRATILQQIPELQG